MTRRQLLAGLVFCLGGLGWAAPDPRRNDLHLEEQISAAQGLCVAAGKAYREWFNGRMHTPQAQKVVTDNLAGLSAFQNKAAQLAVPAARASLRHWARLQKQELNFYLSDFKQGSQRPTQAQLQQRWQNAVAIQGDLLETRRQQLVVVQAGSSGVLAAYYAWKKAVLTVQAAELDLARQVSTAFQQRSSLAGVSKRALTVAAQVESLKAPLACQRAQALYVQRFDALTTLCRAAEDAIDQPDQDSVAILQDNEEIYRQKTLASDDASLAVLRTLLSKTR